MEKIQLLLEAYSSNKKQYIEDKYFKFLKKVYQAAKSTGALNIGFIYYTLSNNSPKSMDLEFMKMYIDSLTPENTTLVVMFTEYWNESMGIDLIDGLPMQFNLSIKEEEVFASLIANNDLEKVLRLLDITADRIANITSKYEEDIFYSKCLNDYERNEFKNAVAGLQFFGFGKKQNIKITNKAMNILDGLSDYEFMQKGLTYIGEEDSNIPVHINDIGDVIDHFENAFTGNRDVEVVIPLNFSISRDDIDEDEAYMEIKKGKVTNFIRKYDLPDSAIEILKKKKKLTNYFSWDIDQLNSGLETYKDDKKIVNIVKELKSWLEKAQTYLEKNVSLTEEDPTDLSTLDAFKEAVVK